MLAEYTERCSLYFTNVENSLKNIYNKFYSKLGDINLNIVNLTRVVSDIYSVLNTFNQFIERCELYFNNVETSLNNIYARLGDIHISINNFHSSFVTYMEQFLNAIIMYMRDFYPSIDFPDDVDKSVYYGWHNFFEAFKDVSLHDYIMNIHQEIENKVNPLSEDNKDNFTATLDSLQNDTIIGDLNTVSDAGKQVIDALGSANPTAHLYIDTLPGEICGISVPVSTIDIDLSWYGKYRKEAHSIISAFMLISWVILMWRRIPAIISGAPMDIFTQRDELPDVVSTDHVTVDDNGELIRHTTVNKNSDGTVITQIHDV